MTEPGTMIAQRYQLVRQLGAGAMGSVWLARDTALGRDVAVKSVQGALRETPDASTEGERRAMREARIIARINHPNAVAIYDVALHQGHPWLVMEYVESRNLAELVREHGPLAPPRAGEVGSQVAAALAEVHRAGVVHRDVKPANVLVAEDGAAKITDFGVARGTGDVTLTASGAMWGTPAYFAPEVAAGSTPTGKADVYSLGASLYFAVEGTPPHGTDSSPLVLLGRIAQQPVPQPRQAGTLTPVLARLLDRDPDNRPTMAEATRLLSGVRGSGWTAPIAEGEGTAPTRGAADDGTDDLALLDSPETGVGVRQGREDAASSEHGSDGRRSRSAAIVSLFAAAAVLAIAALAWILLDPGGEGEGEAASDAGSSASPSLSPSPSPSPSPTPSPTASESPPERGNQPENTPRSNPFTPAAMERTVADYYATMPGDTETGFQMLGPELRSQGFASYEQFWNGIASVNVSDLQARPGNRTVTATVVFETKDGRRSRERHRFGLVPDGSGDGLLINTDTLVR